MADFYLTHEREADRLATVGLIKEAMVAYERAIALNPSAQWLKAKRDRLSPHLSARNSDEPNNPTPCSLFLFLPFYTPDDPERAAELLYCLDQNLANDMFAGIVLLVDDETVLPRHDRRLQMIRLDRRPTYQDWVRVSRRLCPEHISILANSDIFFDRSVASLFEIFSSDPKAFVALSRFDRKGDGLVPHPNPHWSQDVWALRPGGGEEIPEHRLDIPLGVPRCDNKIAYVFATQGFTVYNPFPSVRSIHVHETNLRYYSKKGDRRVIGGVAMVHPGVFLKDPARLDFEIWSAATEQVTSVKLNRSLERWAEEARLAAEPRPSWLAHDADWQYPAITERQAFERIHALLPSNPGLYESVYLGFPFATLIDLHVQLGPAHPRTCALQAKLDAFMPLLKRYSRVFTVAQHIRVRQFPQLFSALGVTDLFWSHCVIGESAFADAPAVRLHPFPLYPVQQISQNEADFGRPRRWLFSFVGARAGKSYLTDTRNQIIDILGKDPRGRIVERDSWHFQQIVYDAQVRGRVAENTPSLVNGDHADAFRGIMDESVFSLCPSGSGPNSIRLWEAMLNGSIPVILANTWAAPGPPELWRAATIRCPETPEAIAGLPHQLSKLAADTKHLRGMRAALHELACRYGPDRFVTDIAGLMAVESSANIQSCSRLLPGTCWRRDREADVDQATDGIADDDPRPSVEDNRHVDEPADARNVSDVRE